MKEVSIEKIISFDEKTLDYPSHVKSNFYIPKTLPKFKFNWNPNLNVFSIGSCFAREIELVLQEQNCTVNSLVALASIEPQGLPVSLMNEYNPGSIAQRINCAKTSMDVGDKCIVENQGNFTDLLINSYRAHSKDWILSRRKIIQNTYDWLFKSNLVIITLGLTEAWYDNEYKLYLNRIPPYREDSSRYSFRMLDVDDCLTLLSPAIQSLTQNNIPVILSVSPIPLSTSFSGRDPIIANEVSKTTLRIVAEELVSHNNLVDYYPSYEAFRTQGMSAYLDDGKHVKFSLVEETVNEMVSRYTNV